jgi:GntR family transcriptional regulator
MTRVFSDKLPLSFQLAQDVRQKILRGDLPTGTQIAPEVQLAREYKVSVITVQRALRFLEEEGLITRQRGRGTFVAELPKRFATPTSPRALDLMFSDEFGKDTKILERRVVPAPDHLRHFFPDVSQVAMYKRLVYQHGEPWSYTIHHLRKELAAKMSDKLLRRYPMFRILREQGMSLKHVEIKLQAQLPSPQVSRLLQCETVDPVLYFVGALYDDNDVVVDVPQIYFRGDRFTFSFDMDLRARD